MSDTPTGYDRTPARYDHARETIDEMRDYLGDEVFAYHCEATALKYWRRMGRKGDADEDLAKMRWYQTMALHVRTGGQVPDPRAGRPGFVPYKWQHPSDDMVAWLDAPPGELVNVPPPKPLPPDVPTVEAVATYGNWWQFADAFVLVAKLRGRLVYCLPGVGAPFDVDPTDPRWRGPITLRP